MKKFGIVIHGGAGTLLKKNMTAKQEAEYKNKLKEAVDMGYSILKKGGSSIQAVQEAIMIMEDSPLFNAGKGSVFTHEGKNEMDASIMEGKTLNAGAIAGVQRIKNPIVAARLVMEHSDHVMLTVKGAETFAKEQGCEIVKPSYFFTKKRWEQLLKAREKDKIQLDHSDLLEDKKFGTVGAVALDKKGNLCAGTSTGGMTNKKHGRVGDSPLIGAGTYANNATCAVSCTGHGEYFIRAVAAHSVSTLMEYKKMSVEKAVREILFSKIKKAGGKGGIIGIDHKGNFTMQFSTEGMYRAYHMSDGSMDVMIYKS